MSKNKKRLLIFTNWFPHRQDPSYGVFIKRQALLLLPHYEVHLLLFKNRWIPSKKSYQENGLIIHENHEPWPPKRNTLFYQYWAYRSAKILGNLDAEFGFDIIHAQDFQPAIACHTYFSKSGKKYFTTIHNTLFLRGKIPSYLEKMIEPALHSSLKVFSVGQQLHDYLLSKYKLNNNILLPNHIDTNLFTYQVKNDSITRFVLVGYLSKVKGTKKVIDAFINANLNDSELHLIGINKLGKSDLEKISAEHSNIIMHGFIENSKLPDIYQKSDCLISFSEVETFGITVIEAMSCGLPIIFKPSGGPEYMVPDYAGLKVDNTIELARAMEIIHLKKFRYDPIRIRNNIVENYSDQVILKRLVNHFENG